MADVFLSYSRKDKEFVRRLYDALAERGRDIWVDWEDIPPTEEWKKEIQYAIAVADTFLFVISPDSIASEICKHEVALAAKKNRRFVPIVRREVRGDEVPEVMAKLNWIFFRQADDFDSAVQSLIKALDLKPLTQMERFMESMPFNYGIRYNEKVRGYHAMLSILLSGLIFVYDSFLLTIGSAPDLEMLFFPLAGIYTGVIGMNSRRKRKFAVVGLCLSGGAFLIGLFFSVLHSS